MFYKHIGDVTPSNYSKNIYTQLTLWSLMSGIPIMQCDAPTPNVRCRW